MPIEKDQMPNTENRLAVGRQEVGNGKKTTWCGGEGEKMSLWLGHVKVKPMRKWCNYYKPDSLLL